MSTAGSSTTVLAPVGGATVSPRNLVVARLSDYAELVKPRISLMVLLTVTVGYTLGSRGVWNFATLWPALVGIALVAFGSSALNQVLECETDARMRRTASRPLPSGRMVIAEAFCFGVGSATVGVLLLATLVNVMTAVLSVITFALYVGAYTPLKRSTSLSTAVGAIPGALPPVLGWTAAGGHLSAEAFSLFAVLFLWQFPHFLAIAWLYRDDYTQAGLRMLPAAVQDRGARRIVGCLALAYALALLPTSLLPAELGMTGSTFSVVAIALGLMYVAAAIQFLRDESTQTARRLLWVSLVYLPVWLLALVVDHLQMLR
ncbi:MAG: protoheme IX farnesyltransferase [Planctomycetales bacterium]|nr:protoheme IX farnesyltransferase [Planctomycetales bacterium]